MNRKQLLTNPVTYFFLSVILYAGFEALNATIVCQSAQTTITTGLLSFLGFWSLVASVVLTYRLKQETGRRHWLWIAIPALIVVLFLFDAYLGRACFYN
jgi:ABC-type dipeptide/oligopeptide/nickel transport system permease subunit